MFFLEIIFYFFTTFRKITEGRFVNQLIKKIWPYLVSRLYELAYGFSNQLIDKMLYHKYYKQMVSLLYEFVYGLLIWTDFECLFHRFHTKVRFFSFVDLRDFFSDLGSRGRKKR